MPRILLAEVDETARIRVQEGLARQHWHVDAVATGREAADRLARHNFHLVISDIRMPGMDAMQLLDLARQSTPYTDVIMTTGFGGVDVAIACLQRGAADYILKPFNMDDLVIRIRRILGTQRLKARCFSLEENCPLFNTEIIGDSEAMQRVRALIRQVAPTDSAVLIRGESGTGKELAAGAIHQNSRRAARPFVRVNCAAIPEGLIESELFGHEQGVFIGARSRKPGKFELAEGGTLLLDEIGELPLPLQAKLLQVLRLSEYERMGGAGTIGIDVRILCASARDLERMVREGMFRQDLFSRLHVISLLIPPLRERREDIPAIASHFIREFSMKRGAAMEVGPEAMQRLVAYGYPGNIRELKNIIERSSVLAPQPVITLADLPADLAWDSEAVAGDHSCNLAGAVAGTERRLVLKALTLTRGRRAEAAELLGISRKNLWEKMKLYAISL